HEILPLCIQYLKDNGVPSNAIQVLIARGVHRKLTREEREPFRSGGFRGVRFEEHDCNNVDKLSALLLTRRGTPVRINRAVKDADVVIILAPISFHYFAGFGGGRKLILPGVADRQAILANHRMSLVEGNPVKLNPKCRPGILEGNPVHEDMLETVEAIECVFGINFATDEEGGVVFINAGDPAKAHAKACDAFRVRCRREVSEPYDVVVVSAGGDPYDIDLLQTHKAIRHTAGAVVTGGTMLLYAECSEGVGSESLVAALSKNHRDFLKTAYGEYAVNNQTAVSILDLTERFKIGMISAMNVDVLLAAGITPCVNAEAFIAEALDKHRSNSLAVVFNGNKILAELMSGGSQ
ncbi:MAG: nickel-dependent lactate racemase, partial [bacterium]|nr:nickel-dependent lactate racemase [bacterium]